MTIEEVLSAKTWEDLFPEDKTAARKKFRQFSKTIHPDINDDPRASDAFIKLRYFYGLQQNGSTAQNGSQTGSKDSLEQLLNDGVFSLSRASGRIFWVALNKSDNDLMRNGEKGMRKLEKEAEAPQFFPKVKGTLRDVQGREGVEVEYPQGTWSLDSYETLEPRNLVWIFKRILVALINAHELGLIHSNLTTKAIMVLPEDHGLILDNWGYHTKKGEQLIVKPEGYVPQEYLKTKRSDEWLDLSKAGDIALNLASKDTPERLLRFFEALKKYRVNDGRLVLQDFEEVTRDVYGDPEFSVLQQPSTPAIC